MSLSPKAIEVLTDLAPPIGLVAFIEGEIDRRKRSGMAVSARVITWLQMWEMWRAGEKVEELETITDEEWNKIKELCW